MPFPSRGQIDRNQFLSVPPCRVGDAIAIGRLTDELVDQSEGDMADSSDDDVTRALRDLIAEGGYAPGARLPSERALIDRLGLTRAALRKALDRLEREGLLWRHVGKGTFVAEGGGAALDEVARHLTPVKMMRARLIVEPAIAREAALNASADALRVLRDAEARARGAPGWSDYEAQDDAFHRAVAIASDNVLLVALFDKLNQARRAVALGTVVRGTGRPPADHASFAQHAAIVAAIAARDPSAAQDAMRDHLASVAARLYADG
jgi:DNA-binding FadR family transcriptional regulator